jgi:hypothetical protein
MSAVKPIDAVLTWRGDESQMKAVFSPSNSGGDALYEGSATAANKGPAK